MNHFLSNSAVFIPEARLRTNTAVDIQFRQCHCKSPWRPLLGKRTDCSMCIPCSSTYSATLMQQPPATTPKDITQVIYTEGSYFRGSYLSIAFNRGLVHGAKLAYDVDIQKPLEIYGIQKKSHKPWIFVLSGCPLTLQCIARSVNPASSAWSDCLHHQIFYRVSSPPGHSTESNKYGMAERNTICDLTEA